MTTIVLVYYYMHDIVITGVTRAKHMTTIVLDLVYYYIHDIVIAGVCKGRSCNSRCVQGALARAPAPQAQAKQEPSGYPHLFFGASSPPACTCTAARVAATRSEEL